MSVDDIKKRIAKDRETLNTCKPGHYEEYTADGVLNAFETAVEALDLELESTNSQNSYDHLSHTLASIRERLEIKENAMGRLEEIEKRFKEVGVTIPLAEAGGHYWDDVVWLLAHLKKAKATLMIIGERDLGNILGESYCIHCARDFLAKLEASDA